MEEPVSDIKHNLHIEQHSCEVKLHRTDNHKIFIKSYMPWGGNDYFLPDSQLSMIHDSPVTIPVSFLIRTFQLSIYNKHRSITTKQAKLASPQQHSCLVSVCNEPPDLT